MKKLLLLATAAAFAVSAPAFAADKETYSADTKIEKDSAGNYSEKDKASKTDAAGTTVSNEKKVKVDVDSKGNVDKTVKTKEVNDPKGLMNKHTTTTKDTEKSKDGTTETSHVKKVDGKTVEDTKSNQ